MLFCTQVRRGGRRSSRGRPSARPAEPLTTCVRFTVPRFVRQRDAAWLLSVARRWLRWLQAGRPTATGRAAAHQGPLCSSEMAGKPCRQNTDPIHRSSAQSSGRVHIRLFRLFASVSETRCISLVSVVFPRVSMPRWAPPGSRDPAACGRTCGPPRGPGRLLGLPRCFSVSVPSTRCEKVPTVGAGVPV